MNKIAQSLKPAWVQRQLELAVRLLPAGSSAAVWLDGKRIAEVGEQEVSVRPLPPTPSYVGEGEFSNPLFHEAPSPLVGEGWGGGCERLQQEGDWDAAMPVACYFPLRLEEEVVGILVVRLPAASDRALMQSWGEAFSCALQGLLEAEQVRHAIARETLDGYRKMALLQHATTEFNRSLKPVAVANALLKQFEGSRESADYGAVFLHDRDHGEPKLLQSFGPESSAVFASFGANPLFADLAERPTGDIINNLADSPWREAITPEIQALLWLPLIAHGENLGLLLLASRRADRFTSVEMKRAQTLVSVAAIALRNAQLYAAEQNMFRSFVGAIASAIDAKSPGTAGHCRRVPEITMLLAEAVNRANTGTFADFTLDEDAWESLELAAWLHDCGKVVTPEWLLEKSTKLQGIHDRIELIALRFEILRRDAALDLQEALMAGQDAETALHTCRTRLQKLDDDFTFIKKCNEGAVFMSAGALARLQDIAHGVWRDRDGSPSPLLTAGELQQLSVQQGNLTARERKIVEDHVVHTLNILAQIPFPKRLRQVPEFAANHHERINGEGYPRGLTGEQLAIPARMIALADVFEALTAPDRPYREPWPLSGAVEILYQMKRDHLLDGDLFELFLQEGIHLAYASKHLAPAQNDDIDIARYLG